MHHRTTIVHNRNANSTQRYLRVVFALQNQAAVTKSPIRQPTKPSMTGANTQQEAPKQKPEAD
jgi:hypothetical protein